MQILNLSKIKTILRIFSTDLYKPVFGNQDKLCLIQLPDRKQLSILHYDFLLDYSVWKDYLQVIYF